MPIYHGAMGKTSCPSAGGSKEAAPEAASIPEQPKEAAKDAISAIRAAAPEQPKQAAQEAASAAKDALPDAPKELSNPLKNLFGGARPSAVAKHISNLFTMTYKLHLPCPDSLPKSEASAESLRCMLPYCDLAPSVTARLLIHLVALLVSLRVLQLTSNLHS